MPDSRPEELIEAEKLMYAAKFDEALHLINDFEEKGALSSNDQLSLMLLKGKIYGFKHEFQDAVDMGRHAYHLAKELELISESIDALILRAHLVYLGDIDKALKLTLKAEKLLNSLAGKSSSALFRQRANILYLKSTIAYIKGDYDRTLELSLQSLALREKFGEKLEISEHLMGIGRLFFTNGEHPKAIEYFKKSLTLKRELKDRAGIAAILPFLATCYFDLGELDQALEICEQALSVKESNIADNLHILLTLGLIYTSKGELNRALKYTNQGITIAEENGELWWLASFQHNIGWIYLQKGDLDRAKDYFLRCLNLSKKAKNLIFMVHSLGALILINIKENSREQAHRYLKEFKEFVDQTRNKAFTQKYLLAKSELLRTSGRRRDSVEAEMLLKQIVDDKMINSATYIAALIMLCTLLLEELSMYNNPIVLDDINPLITRLLNLAEEQHSYYWLAEAKLLQAKLKLIQLDIGGAKQLFVQAQRIADLHGLQGLAQNISNEHDTLLEQINLWNSLKKRNAPMSERIKLAVFDEVVDRLEGKRAVKPPNLTEEVPVLLLIIDEGGIPAFSKPFTEELSVEDDIISSFLAAFNTFSEEVFSKGLDRAKFGEYMLVMDSIGSFTVCYLFKGQSYLAKQKVIHFAHRVQNTAPIWQVFKSYYKTNQSIVLSKNPLLESLITEIFLKRSPELSI